MNDTEKQLSESYAQKGKLITNLEIMRGQLEMVNQRISELMQQNQSEKQDEKKDKKVEDKKK